MGKNRGNKRRSESGVKGGVKEGVSILSKTNLTEEEKAKIIEALNRDTEPSPDLMEKLFPSLAEKFDVAKLDRGKVVTLEYAGKRSRHPEPVLPHRCRIAPSGGKVLLWRHPDL